ncbi:hypothetical protein GPECTOR_345g92 [Gonium pectorale]|uniref:Uncharacterized protein n=1 Tax=Gonium pectorale TaxID=33097 RepID=A0A150FVK7_GONPE|nr:hypothetical protein GPECTOR_345g92 [Gonium pectorale]|eukprot:KXZ41642.1 hypothetical protein GPECTOR_345g92 [Gonium pectorale]
MGGPASSEIPCAVQLLVGVLITSLFVVIRPLSFPLACLAPVLYASWVVLLSADNHLGSRLQGGAAAAAAMAWGAVLGGVVLSVALHVACGRAGGPGGGSGPPPIASPAHTAALCGLSVALLPLLTSNRAALGPPHPPHLWMSGLTSCLAFGITVLSGQLIADERQMWSKVVLSLVIVSLLGGGVSGLVAAAVLPSLAADELRADTAAAVRGLGHAATSVDRSNGGVGVGGLSSGASDSSFEFQEGSPADDDLESDDAFLRMLQDASEPPQRRRILRAASSVKCAAATAGGGGSGGGEAAAAAVALSRLSLPPFLAPPGGIGPSPAAAAAATALGSGPGACAHGGGGVSDRATVVWVPVSALRPLLARARACLASAALEPPWLMSGPSDLRRWSVLLSRCEGLLDRVAALECLVEGEGRGQQALRDSSLRELLGVDVIAPYRLAYGNVAASCARIAAALTAASNGGGDGGAKRGAGPPAKIRILGIGQSRALMFLWSVTEGVLTATQQLEAAVAELLLQRGPPGGAAGIAQPAAAAAARGMTRDWEWALRVLRILLGWYMVRNAVGSTLASCRLLLAGGPAGRRRLLRSRTFQFGVKYWLAVSAVLVLVVGLTARDDVPILRRYPPLYGYIATSVSMTERVESTLSRSVLRLGGTIAGGTLGLAVLLHGGLAGNPFAALPILCAAAFLVGLVAGHKLRVAIVLTLVTLNSMTLCTRGSAAAAAALDTYGGVLKLYGIRVLTVALGCTLPVLMSQAVLPWFTSDWALEVMAGAYDSSAIIVRQLYDRFFEEGRRAHMAAHGRMAMLTIMSQFGLTPKPNRDGEAQAESSASEAEVETEADKEAGQGPSGPSIKDQVWAPLVAVQSSLMRDTAVLQLADRLGALALVVADTPPLVHGRLGGWAFEHIMLPLHADMTAMFDAMDRVVVQTVDLLRGEPNQPPSAPQPAAASRRTVSCTDGNGNVRGAGSDGGGGGDDGRGDTAAAERAAARRRRSSTATAVGSGSRPHTPQLDDLEAAAGVSPSGLVASPAEGDRTASPPSSRREELQRAVCDLNRARLRVRRRLRIMRHAFHSCVLALDEQHLSYATHPDDAVRVNATLFALVKVLDRVTATARAVLAQEPWAGRHRAPKRLWLG